MATALNFLKNVDSRKEAGPFFAILKRIEHNKDYFDRVWKLQPRYMAVFGKDTAEIFMKLRQTRRRMEVSASMLLRAAIRNEPYRDAEFRERLENDIWNVENEKDKVGPNIKTFVEGVERHCSPVVAHRYTKNWTQLNAKWLWQKIGRE